jgi:hypothetical protein
LRKLGLNKKFEELYAEEREKNLALRNHLEQQNKEKDDKKQIPRNQSARPRSASKYGRKNESNNATNNEPEEPEPKEIPKAGTQDEFGSNASAEKEILLNRINFKDIESIALDLRFKLQSKKVDYKKISSILPVNSLSLNDLKDLFTTQYGLEETDALMAARFICEEDEDQEESKILFDEDKQIESSIAAKKIQNFVRLNNDLKPYNLYNEKKEKEMGKQILGVVAPLPKY